MGLRVVYIMFTGWAENKSLDLAYLIVGRWVHEIEEVGGEVPG